MQFKVLSTIAAFGIFIYSGLALGETLAAQNINSDTAPAISLEAQQLKILESSKSISKEHPEQYTVLEGYHFVTEAGIRGFSNHLVSSQIQPKLFWNLVQSLLEQPKEMREKLWKQFTKKLQGPRHDLPTLEPILMLANPIVLKLPVQAPKTKLCAAATKLCVDTQEKNFALNKACENLHNALSAHYLDEALEHNNWRPLWSYFDGFKQDPGNHKYFIPFFTKIFQKERIFSKEKTREEAMRFLSEKVHHDFNQKHDSQLKMLFNLNYSAHAGRGPHNSQSISAYGVRDTNISSSKVYHAGGSTASDAWVKLVQLDTQDLANGEKQIPFRIHSYARGGYRGGGGLFGEPSENGTSIASYNITGTLDLPQCKHLQICEPVSFIYFLPHSIPPDSTMNLEIVGGQSIRAGETLIVDRMKGNQQLRLTLTRYHRHVGAGNDLPEGIHSGLIRIYPGSLFWRTAQPSPDFIGVGNELRRLFLSNSKELLANKEWNQFHQNIILPLYQAKKLTEGKYEVHPQDFNQAETILNFFYAYHRSILLEQLGSTILELKREQKLLPLETLFSAVRILSTITLTQDNLDETRNLLEEIALDQKIELSSELVRVERITDYEKLLLSIIKIREALLPLQVKFDELEEKIQYLSLLEESL